MRVGDHSDPPTAPAAPATATSPTLRNKRPRPPDMDPDARHPDDPFQHEDGGDEDEDDDDEDGTGPPKNKSDKKAGRRKIKIEFIQDKSRRHITFSKRKAGIMKKAYELSTLTGTQVLLLVVSETGLVYTFTTAKLQPLVTQPEGKNLIQACLNAPNGAAPTTQPIGQTISRAAPQGVSAPPVPRGPPGNNSGMKDDDEADHGDEPLTPGARSNTRRRTTSSSQGLASPGKGRTNSTGSGGGNPTSSPIHSPSLTHSQTGASGGGGGSQKSPTEISLTSPTAVPSGLPHPSHHHTHPSAHSHSHSHSHSQHGGYGHSPDMGHMSVGGVGGVGVSGVSPVGSVDMYGHPANSLPSMMGNYHPSSLSAAASSIHQQGHHPSHHQGHQQHGGHGGHGGNTASQQAHWGSLQQAHMAAQQVQQQQQQQAQAALAQAQAHGRR